MSQIETPDPRGATVSTVPSPPYRSLKQIRGFDGIRGVGVLIVFCSHLEVILPIATVLVVPGGTVSLDMFFVMSGFLITTLLLNEQSRTDRVSIRYFYLRRVVRLLPALYVVVLALALFAYFTHTWSPLETPSIFSVLFYYANYYSASASGVFSPKLASGFQHLWSLSFEEQFYLVWPWVTIALLTVRMRLRTVVTVLLTFIVIIGVYRGISFETTGRWWSIFQRTDTRADSIMWGALLAHLWVRRREPTRGIRIAAWIAAAYLIGCLIFTTQYGPFLYLGGFDTIDISCGIILLAVLDGKWGGKWLFEFTPFVALGLVSYAFYLWHLPVFFAMRYFNPHWAYALRIVVAFAVTLTLTLLSWFLLERPLMRWRRNRDPRLRTGHADSEAPGDAAERAAGSHTAKSAQTMTLGEPTPDVGSQKAAPPGQEPSGAS